MKESEKYKLSTFQSIDILHKTDSATVELVECSLDGKKYIKKTYHSDKRAIFTTLSAISSPFLPKVFDVFFCEDTIVIEEYIEGKTLEQLLETAHSFSRREVLTIFDTLLSGLSTLHDNNIIHRDIKPSNIIIRENGQAVLIDFSIARVYSAARSSDTELFGTVGYAAPEQFGFSQSDYRTDIYAFGVTMKLILAQRNVSKYIFDAAAQCTEFDPSKRFQSVGELKNYIKNRKRRHLIGIVTLCVMGACLITALTIYLWPSALKVVQPEVVEHKTVEPETLKDDLLYSPGSARIVNTNNAGEDIPCLQMWEDRTYHAEISLSRSSQKSQIVVKKAGSKLEISVDDSEVLTFENTDHPSTDSYPDGKILAELVFYDLNKDGNMEIVPIICDAIVAQYGADPEVSLLRNYTLGWCIYYDAAAGYQTAEGRMSATLDSFKIYASASGCLWVDFPSYYTLNENKLVLKS